MLLGVPVDDADPGLPEQPDVVPAAALGELLRPDEDGCSDSRGRVVDVARGLGIDLGVVVAAVLGPEHDVQVALVDRVEQRVRPVDVVGEHLSAVLEGV